MRVAPFVVVACLCALAPGEAWADGPPSPSDDGAILMALGSFGMVLGGAAATAGAALRECGGRRDEPSCGLHYGLVVGGLAFAGASGGFLYGFGTRLHKNHHGGEPEDGPRYDAAVFGAGVSLVVVGGAAAAAGFALSLIGGCTLGCTFDPVFPASPILLGVGVPLAAIGAPMLSVGGRRIVAGESALAPRFQLNADGARLTWLW